MRKMLIIIIILLTFGHVNSQTKYVTTIHPFKVILEEVVGARGDVYRILPPGASPHTYEMRPSSIKKVENATALIIGGENLDEWARKFPNPTRIELIDLIPKDSLLFLETQDEYSTNEIETGDGHHRHSSIDPHFWTDPLLVKSLVVALVEKLCSIDKEGIDIYRENSKHFMTHLDSLYLFISQKLKPVQGKRVMLSHPFFRYFFRRFDIDLVGLVEASPGKEPTPKEIRDMVKLINEKNVKAIFTHPQLPDRSAKLVAEASSAKAFQLDPIGGISGRQTYDELLLYNVNMLLEALQ